jgi:arylsulfatase A-like enzyme
MPDLPTPEINVLFITADQWRGDCLSASSALQGRSGPGNHPTVRTPNLDRLAGGGVWFRRHFAQSAPCAPSRASLYTGMYLMNHRAASNGTPLDARFTNVALVARDAGYEPALFGYTDMSVDPRTVAPDDPRLYSYEGVLPGFDPVCHLPAMDPEPWLQYLRKHGYTWDGEWYLFTEAPHPEHRWRTNYAAAHSQTTFLTEQLLDYVDDRGDRPWFAHLSWIRPHPPFLAPAPYDSMYDPASVPEPLRAPTREEEGAQHPLLGMMIGHPLLAAPADPELRELRATYYGMMSEVDDNLGRILDWLDDSGQADRTIVVFTSDHGELLGDHWILQKLGWFDQAYHVPLLVRDPRRSFDGTRGRVVDDVFTEHVDVLPMLAELIGADVPLQCDGRSLLPWLEGDTPADWRREAHWEFDLRDPDSPLLENAFGVTMEECSLAVLRDDHGKYVQFAGNHVFPAIFFDLDTDPGQWVNRAGDPAYASRVLDYAQRMLAWRMRHTERTLSGMKLTMHAGLVERRAPRVR